MATLTSIKNKYLRASDGDDLGVSTNTENISLLAFKLATADSLAKFNLVDGFADDYNDATGVDATGSTNEVRNATGNYYSGVVDDLNTLLLIHSDESDGSTTFTDSSYYARTIVSGGSIDHSTDQGSPDAALGATAIQFDGSSKFLSISPYSVWMPTGAFTFEAWFWQSGGGWTNYDTWASTWHDSNRTGFNLWTGEDSGREANWEAEYGSTEVLTSTGTTAYTNNAWHHFAVSRDSSNVIRVFINGTQDGTDTQAGTLTGTSGYPLTLGSRPVGATRRWWDGYLTEIRWSDVARYTSNFTAPTDPFSATSIGNLTLVSNSYTAQSAPSLARIIIDEESFIGSTAVNTDITAEVSRDDGTTFTTITLADQGQINYLAGIDTYTKLMLHCDGSNGGTTFTDSSGSVHTVTANADVHTDTTIKKFGTAAAQFDGTGDYLGIADSTEWDFGTDAFTIDFWWYKDGGSGERVLFTGNSSANATRIHIYENSGTLYADAYDSDSNFVSFGSTTSIASDAWYHLALVRSGTNVYFFNNGAIVATTAVASKPFNQGPGLDIGRNNWNGSYWQGYIDEFRISTGIARWTAAFNPWAEAYAHSRRLLSGSVDISGQPSGTSMKYRIKTLNQATTKDTRVYGTSMAWA